jgi:LPXTG-motif cell wall-anchored protein
MNKKVLILLFVVIFLFFSFSINNINAEEIVKEIDISTSPHKVFFNITNAKPGDTFSKIIKVENKGTKDFNYLFSNRLLSGSDKFYNDLILTVTDKTGEIYKGKLKNFEKSFSRSLKSEADEDLSISIYFPLELGNDYQSLTCEFQFKFYVEGTLGGFLPADGPKLPNTGSGMFNILVAGAVLVLTGSMFQLIVKRRSRLRNEL